MEDELKARDVEVVNGDLIVSVPGDGIVLVEKGDLLELARTKGLPVGMKKGKGEKERDG
jgi:hypothetical protein